MNRGGWLIRVGLLPFIAVGCLPYAYPKLSYIPGIELGPKGSDVHAFGSMP